MTLKGYFTHKSPNLIPSSFGFAYVLGKLGLNTDPTFNANWDKVKYIRRGIYQRPIVTSDNDAFKHSAFLIELCQYNNPAWNDMPLMLNILVPNIDLTFINVWVSRIVEVLNPKEKPLLFTTPKHWNVNLQGGPNSEVVSKTILQNADIICSQYKTEQPAKMLYVDKLKYWEYSDGLMQYAPDSIFDSIVTVSSSQEESGNAPETGNLPGSTVEGVRATDITMHLTCPICNHKIF